MISILAVAYKGTKKKAWWHVSCYEVNGFPNPHRFSAPVQFNHSPGSYRGNILSTGSPSPGREYRRGHRFSWEETGIMKNNRIVKMVQWCIGGILILLIGVGGILSPLGTHTVHAASMQIKDDAGVLDRGKVRS